MKKLNLEFKKQVYNAFVNLVEDKNKLLQSELFAAQESGNNETKSSAGDKHETGRALAQLAQENLGKQLQQMRLLNQSLSAINPDIQLTKVENGALVQTDSMLIYVGISLGELTLNDKKVFSISLGSPIGQALKGKQVSDQFTFRNKTIKILNLI